MKKNLYNTMLLTLLALTSISMAADLPKPLQEMELQEVGRGKLNWFGFRIYKAGLWTPNGRFDNFKTNKLAVLSIKYQRNIKCKDLLKQTQKEWAQLGIVNEEQQQKWLKQLQDIWPDVKPGDILASVIDDKKETRFFNQNKLLGSIKDPNFGPAFLAIWLDSNCKHHTLRKALLEGNNKQKTINSEGGL